MPEINYVYESGVAYTFFVDLMGMAKKYKDVALELKTQPNMQFAMSVISAMLYMLYRNKKRELRAMSETASTLIDNARARDN